jgi:acetyl-CoA acetyltransferase
MASLLAGLPVSVPATTVNRLCGSSLDAAIVASRQIALGEADVVMAGGVESMSRAQRWLVASVVPQFRRFDADTRLVNASLRHILDEARDLASTPCVLPRSPADGPRRAAQPRLWHRPRPTG